jgi:heat shock protein HslJ
MNELPKNTYQETTVNRNRRRIMQALGASVLFPGQAFAEIEAPHTESTPGQESLLDKFLGNWSLYAATAFEEDIAPQMWMRFEEGGQFAAFDGCEEISGTYTLENNRLYLDLNHSEKIECIGGVDVEAHLFRDSLQSARLTIEIHSGSLYIHNNGNTLFFRK